MPTQKTSDASTDICLLLEGTWPYVRGGVSSWINQMILGMPEVTFSIVFIGGARDAYPTQQYIIQIMLSISKRFIWKTLGC